VGPEALAGGPIGKVRDGDRVRIVIDPVRLEGILDVVGAGDFDSRPPRADLRPHPDLPEDTRLWAALQGGTWGGCVYDTDSIVQRLERP